MLCDDVRREDNGKFILIGLFESISAQKFPATHPALFVINRWCKGVGKFVQKIKISSSRSKDIIFQANDQVFELHDMDGHHTLVSKINNLVFPEPGKYWMEVFIDNELMINFPIILKEIKSESH